MKKKLFAILLLVVFAFVSCGKEKVEEYPKVLNMTYVKAPLNIPSILGRNDGLFQKAFDEVNTEVKFSELTTGPEQIQALASGQMDILYALSCTSALIGASNGVDLKITGVYTRAPKVFMILTKDENINSPKDFIGKKVAGPKGTILHQLLVTYLNTENVNVDDVEFLNMGLPGAMSALLNGSVDIALLAGPVALNTIKSGAKVITTGEGLVQGLVVTAVRGDFLEKYPKAMEKFNKTNDEILNIINNNFEDIVDKVAKEVENTPEEVRTMFPLYDFNTTITEDDIKDLKATQDFLIANGLQEKAIDIESIIVK